MMVVAAMAATAVTLTDGFGVLLEDETEVGAVTALL
jgi:hypothetical protein